MIEKIDGFEIKQNEKTSRIIDINISDEVLNKLIFHLINLTLLHLNTNHLQGLQLLKV